LERSSSEVSVGSKLGVSGYMNDPNVFIMSPVITVMSGKAAPIQGDITLHISGMGRGERGLTTCQGHEKSKALDKIF
jgi:hypothetical protein